MATAIKRKRLEHQITPVLQILDLKQLAEMEDSYKKKCIETLHAYKDWKEIQKSEKDMIALLYGNLEGIMLRRHAEETIKLYWKIRTDFRKGFKDYIQNNCGRAT